MGKYRRQMLFDVPGRHDTNSSVAHGLATMLHAVIRPVLCSKSPADMFYAVTTTIF